MAIFMFGVGKYLVRKKKIRDEGLICLTYIMVGKAEHQVGTCVPSQEAKTD